MVVHLLLIMTQKTQFATGPTKEKFRIRAGMRIMAAGTFTIFKWFVLRELERQFLHLLVAQQAHLPLGHSQHVFLIGPVGVVAYGAYSRG